MNGAGPGTAQGTAERRTALTAQGTAERRRARDRRTTRTAGAQGTRRRPLAPPPLSFVSRAVRRALRSSPCPAPSVLCAVKAVRPSGASPPDLVGLVAHVVCEGVEALPQLDTQLVRHVVLRERVVHAP